MNKRNLIVIIIAIVIATSALALGGGSIAQNSADEKKAIASSPSGLKPKPEDTGTVPQSTQPSPQGQGDATQPQDQTVPQHVVYGQMFRHIKELKKNADEEDRQGKDGSHFRTLYKRMAKLEDYQAAVLDQIAAETDAEIEKLNKKAKKIIDEIRGQHPEGKLAQGELPPTPPAGLKALSDERRNQILQARERLRAAFGEEAFQKFDEFAQQRIKPGVRRLDAPNRAQGQ